MSTEKWGDVPGLSELEDALARIPPQIRWLADAIARLKRSIEEAREMAHRMKPLLKPEQNQAAEERLESFNIELIGLLSKLPALTTGSAVMKRET
jgi:hypothetical protein